MRAALISLPMPGEGQQPLIAGKSIAERQLLFACEAGCDAIIAHGGGASEQAIALRHAAESAGLRFQIISNCHALEGAIGRDDTLLVFQPLLLPEAVQALDLMRADSARMLVVSAGPGVSAGLERIDLDRAWAGVLTMPGHWLSRLSALPEDATPHAALLRICLQMRLPEARLPDHILDSTGWTIVRSGKSAAFIEQNWLGDLLGKTEIAAPSRWLAARFVERGGARLLSRKWPVIALTTGALALLAGAVSASWYDLPVLAFAMIAAAVPLLESSLALNVIARAPFAGEGHAPLSRWLIDAAMLAVAILAIDSFWYRAAFPAFALGVALRLLDRHTTRLLQQVVKDRGCVAAMLAAISALTSAEIAVMAAATLSLFAMLLPPGGKRQ